MGLMLNALLRTRTHTHIFNSAAESHPGLFIKIDIEVKNTFYVLKTINKLVGPNTLI